MDDYQQNVEIRNMQFQETQDFAEKTTDEERDGQEGADTQVTSTSNLNNYPLIVIKHERWW